MSLFQKLAKSIARGSSQFERSLNLKVFQCAGVLNLSNAFTNKNQFIFRKSLQYGRSLLNRSKKNNQRI